MLLCGDTAHDVCWLHSHGRQLSLVTVIRGPCPISSAKGFVTERHRNQSPWCGGIKKGGASICLTGLMVCLRHWGARYSAQTAVQYLCSVWNGAEDCNKNKQDCMFYSQMLGVQPTSCATCTSPRSNEFPKIEEIKKKLLIPSNQFATLMLVRVALWRWMRRVNKGIWSVDLFHYLRSPAGNGLAAVTGQGR